MAIDWNAPLEGVNETGTVVDITDLVKDDDNDCRSAQIPGRSMTYFNTHDGVAYGTGWWARNRE